VSLIARHLETAGIPTLVMGSARDIVESAGAPRFYYSEFPLGHSAGKPHDIESQWQSVSGALGQLESATDPGETVVSGQLWSESDAWQHDYLSLTGLSATELADRRAQHADQRAVAQALRDTAQAAD
jgi:hypothetical protein